MVFLVLLYLQALVSSKSRKFHDIDILPMHKLDNKEQLYEIGTFRE